MQQLQSTTDYKINRKVGGMFIRYDKSRSHLDHELPLRLNE